MRNILENIVGSLAKQILQKYKPLIVGITGSIGKTSTRRAVVAGLSFKFRVSTPPRNLNDKLGLPLGVIGLDSPGKSLIGWFKVVVRAMGLLLGKARYPEVLVLEYGIDRVGEMEELLNIANPSIGVLTGIGVSHYEFFQDPETISQEKSKLIKAVSKDSFVVINSANPAALAASKGVDAKVFTYGMQDSDYSIASLEEDFSGISSKVVIKGIKTNYELQIRALGAPHISGLAAAVAVAENMGVEKEDLEKGLSSYAPVPGRLNVLQGLKKSWVIDDTYNASPESTIEALNLFSRFPARHKIAVLGDMLELGSISQKEHEKIGKAVAEIMPNHLITVGEMGKVIADVAKSNGLPEERVLTLDDSKPAASLVHDLVEEGSLTLVKGSQGVRLERVTKEVIAEPMRARELLARQDEKWLNS